MQLTHSKVAQPKQEALWPHVCLCWIVLTSIKANSKLMPSASMPGALFVFCLPQDRTWHKVNDPKVDYSWDLGEGQVRYEPRLKPCCVNKGTVEMKQVNWEKEKCMGVQKTYNLEVFDPRESGSHLESSHQVDISAQAGPRWLAGWEPALYHSFCQRSKKKQGSEYVCPNVMSTIAVFCLVLTCNILTFVANKRKVIFL